MKNIILILLVTLTSCVSSSKDCFAQNGQSKKSLKKTFKYATFYGGSKW